MSELMLNPAYQENIPRTRFSYSDTFSLGTNWALFIALKSNPDSYIKSHQKNYRIGIIIVELLRYVWFHRLLQFPSTVVCDQFLYSALRVQSFQLSQITDVIYMNAKIEATPRFDYVQELQLRAIEKVMIMQFVLNLSQLECFQGLF